MLRALAETERTLVNYRAAIERRRLLQAALDQASGAARIARARQREGQVDFPVVLDAERTLADARADLAAADAKIGHAQVDLSAPSEDGGKLRPPNCKPRLHHQAAEADARESPDPAGCIALLRWWPG